jgi:glycosyltransferase involved in cell wall biosynthesis
MKRLCVLLPAFNEAEHIGDLVRRIRRIAIPDLEITPLVVNDGSRDATAALAAEAGGLVISHPVNRGVGAAFRTGILHAREQGFDYLVHMDSDGQVNPDEIPKLMAPLLRDEADLVLGSRFCREFPANLKQWKVVALRTLTGTLSLLAASRLTDISCGFRAMNRRVLLELEPHFDYDYIQESLLQALAARARTVDVPVTIHYGEEAGGMSRRPLRYISRFLGIMGYGLFHFYRRRIGEAFGARRT